MLDDRPSVASPVFRKVGPVGGCSSIGEMDASCDLRKMWRDVEIEIGNAFLMHPR
jgi:hypothetical protein